MTSPEALIGQDPIFLQKVLDSLEDPIFMKDRQHRWVVFNTAFCQLLGRPREELLGKSDPDFFPPEQVEVFWANDDELFDSGEGNEKEEILTDEEGVEHTIWTRKHPVHVDGEVVGLIGIISDITALRARLDAVETLEQRTAQQQARLEAQQELIDTMAVPVLSVWEGILLVPLVGEVSERRASLVLEHLLDAITREHARVVFLDVSGVPEMNESSAGTLAKAVAAAGLLGASAEIVGVSPTIAQLLTNDAMSFAGIRTHATLRAGLRSALERLA